MTRWAVKVERFDDGDIHVDTWRTTVEADTEDGAEDAALHAYAVLPDVTLPFADGTSFATRAERMDGD